MTEIAERPHFLLCNDDGFRAPGIQELAQALRPLGEITIVAPEGPRSGYSSAISTTLPLRLKPRVQEEGFTVYSVEGTPVDCVKLALYTIFSEELPTIVISGINHGSNDGVCVHYSGTIGAAREACIQGVPALAVSLDDTAERPNFSEVIAYTLSVVHHILEQGMPSGQFLSLNVPKSKPLGLKVCPQAVSRFVDEFMPSKNARGHNVYWMQGYQHLPKPQEQPTDVELLRQGYATITPLMLDQTDYATLAKLAKVESSLERK
ncbi:MAG: 5'/3'-nucleotidase SurE [Porphyromonadaceae bacterium]|nr:5'/3'-nucleotidase SurE [Porphyromonadaceae bacterium]